MRRIVTNYEFPPIPDRRFDWCAYYDGDEESGRIGRGATEAEAIKDFVANYVEDDDARLIAVAPELLAALKAIASDGWLDDATMDHMPGVKLARDAIAKTEGRP